MFSAAVLAWIEEDAGIRIADHFDLITGTSTEESSPWVWALASDLGKSFGSMLRKRLGSSNGESPSLHSSIGSFESIGNDALEAALKRCFGAKRLSDSLKRLIVPAYNLGQDDVYLFKTPHHEKLRRDYRVPMWQVALATSAATTYFPCCMYIDRMRLIDGGVWANNPTLIGIAEAVSMCGAKLESISVFLQPRDLQPGGRAAPVPRLGRSFVVGAFCR